MTAARLIAFVLAVGSSVVLSGAAFAQQPVPRWFNYAPEVERDWIVSADTADPMHFTAHPKNATGASKRILVLYPRASSAYDVAISTILQHFYRKGLSAEFSIINFELKTDKGFEALRVAEKGAFDLVFAMGSESSAWLYTHYKGGKLPVVTVCSKDPVQLKQVKAYDSGSGANFAFTSLNVPVEVQMAYVMELRPNLKNIAILVDKKNLSAMETQAEPVANFARQRGINVIWAEVTDPKNARIELERVLPAALHEIRKTDPALTQSLFWLTGSTSVFKEIDTINRYAERVPVISVVPELVAEGDETAALAIGISFESNARLAAVYAEQILAGAAPGQMKVGLVSPPDVSISFRKARQIGLRVPFTFFEIASSIYDYEGKPARRVKEDLPSN